MKKFIPILDDEIAPEVYGVNDDDNMPELEDGSIEDATSDDDSIRDTMPELVDSRELIDGNELTDDEDDEDDMPELEPNMERSIRIIYIFIFLQT
jgi:hypothetical protein